MNRFLSILCQKITYWRTSSIFGPNMLKMPKFRKSRFLTTSKGIYKGFQKATYVVFWGFTRFLGTQKVIFTNFLSNFSWIRHGICNWSWFCCFRIFHHFLPKFSLILSRKKCKNPQNRQNSFFRKIVLRRF